ncbi:hypothetical protein ACNRWW_19600 [Metabacillus sp. HB246100]
MEPHFEHDDVITKEYGKQLLSFDNLFAAKAYFYEVRKEQLSLLEQLCEEFTIPFTYTIHSLQKLEEFYFSLFQQNLFFDLQVTIEEVEQCLSLYVCETLIRNYGSDAEWIVQEYAFEDKKYTMGIRYGRNHLFFENMFSHLYLMKKDASSGVLTHRYERMKKFCKE